MYYICTQCLYELTSKQDVYYRYKIKDNLFHVGYTQITTLALIAIFQLNVSLNRSYILTINNVEVLK